MGKHGENIRKRKDGRWEARIIDNYDLAGKAKYRSFYGKTYLEAKGKRNDYIINNYNNFHLKKTNKQSDITIEAIMDQWLNSIKSNIKESTFSHYSYLLIRHILPELGTIYVSNLTTEMVDSFLKQKFNSGRIDGKGGLGAKTVADIRSVLLSGLKYAYHCNYPCSLQLEVFHPPVDKPVIKVLTRKEQEQLESFLCQHLGSLEAGIIVALYGGLRIGEICALQWGDINFENETIQVSKTMIRIQNVDKANDEKKTKILISSPKTQSSNRLIPMPSFVMKVLSQIKQEADIFLITGTTSYMEPRTYLEKYKQILKKAGLKPFPFHSLRHTFATRCVESGFDAKSLSEILGHANVNTTLQRYVHPSIDVKKEQMNRLQKISIWGQNDGQ